MHAAVATSDHAIQGTHPRCRRGGPQTQQRQPQNPRDHHHSTAAWLPLSATTCHAPQPESSPHCLVNGILLRGLQCSCWPNVLGWPKLPHPQAKIAGGPFQQQPTQGHSGRGKFTRASLVPTWGPANPPALPTPVDGSYAVQLHPASLGGASGDMHEPHHLSPNKWGLRDV
jgi:hypothetical protein